MQRMIPKFVLVLLPFVFLLGCSKLTTQLTKPDILAPGTLVLKFSKNIKGPIDLTIDGFRIKVDQTSKGGNTLTITGLEPTSHRYTISSPNDAFGPSSAEIVLPDDEGISVRIFAQSFDSILYGNSSGAVSAESPKNIRAILRKL